MGLLVDIIISFLDIFSENLLVQIAITKRNTIDNRQPKKQRRLLVFD